MNKQHKTYLLLLTVLVIWSLIGYQVYTRLNPAIPEFEALKMKTPFSRDYNLEVEVYQVNPSYRDPFLGKFPQKKKIVIKKIVKPKVTVRFPNIVYNGIIEGNSKSFILTINNRQEILKIGQEIYEVKLLKANAKEAIVSFKGVKKTVLLQ